MASERRSYPRYPVQCPVIVTLPDDPNATFKFQSNSISRTSIEIECNHDLITALLRQQGLPYKCQLKFSLPSHKYTFNVPASVVTHRRLSQQDYVLVLLLRHNDSAQEDLLDRHLASQNTVIGLD
ncbi:MAG: PilZ domain-containing protein [Pseudomonadota bacterium]|nr:PilZ domain-containing protein [Pseudomonadota bacterium]